MAIDTEMIRGLREQSGAGVMDCRRALVECGGDLEKAVAYLRQRGLYEAEKKRGRKTSEGAIGSYIHAGGRIGVLLEINCETDFVARTDTFRELLKDVAMHIAAADPRAVERQAVSPSVLEEQRQMIANLACSQGEPADRIPQLVEKRLEQFYQEYCLYEQPFIKDVNRTVREYLSEKILALGENVTVRRFVRYQLGALTE